ncbi:hypothetical protein [Actinomycetospora aeridis]|uniref:Tail assembly chaperone n=1 Tax=Actinomycetospora aeridis TaxID=3129231 RepID=A0ABU8N194_9PSEU
MTTPQQPPHAQDEALPPNGTAPAPVVDAGPVMEDFDAFWAQYQTTKPQVRILGEVVPIPHDMPLWVEQLSERGRQNTVADLHKMVDALYGANTLQRWIDRGAGLKQLKVIIAWTTLRVQGRQVTFADAMTKADELEAAEAAREEAAKANPQLGAAAAAAVPGTPDGDYAAAVAEAGKALSASTGAPSSPTSDASTASPPPSWPEWAAASSGGTSTTSPATPSSVSSSNGHLGS